MQSQILVVSSGQLLRLLRVSSQHQRLRQHPPPLRSRCLRRSLHRLARPMMNSRQVSSVASDSEDDWSDDGALFGRSSTTVARPPVVANPTAAPVTTTAAAPAPTQAPTTTATASSSLFGPATSAAGPASAPAPASASAARPTGPLPPPMARMQAAAAADDSDSDSDWDDGGGLFGPAKK
ncbi:hypothetical protein PINS_up010252 [Pythium insidiosum]|nr:hypothetical protein PINS_up010252 [Pythium insidiosum]